MKFYIFFALVILESIYESKLVSSIYLNEYCNDMRGPQDKCMFLSAQLSDFNKVHILQNYKNTFTKNEILSKYINVLKYA